MSPAPSVDPAEAHRPDARRARRHCEQAARHYDEAAWLPRQVAEALMEHLAPVRMTPGRVLDAGAGTGICTRLLRRRYRSARVFSLDSSPAMLGAGRRPWPRWLTRDRLVCGDAEAIPLADASVDLAVSSLMLPTCPRPERVLAELHRVLVPGGLLMLASLGPDTLRELRQSWMAVDRHVHVQGFIDMHDLGDALLRTGFQDVVMDAERITGRYASVAELTGELKRLGATNAAVGSARGLTTRSRLAAMSAAYDRLRADGALPASYEVVFAHAWRAPSRSVEVSSEALARGPASPRQ